MASIEFDISLNMATLDINRLSKYFVSSNLYDNANLTFGGITYQDVFLVEWNFSGSRASAFGGFNLTKDLLGNINGGTVTGYLELAWNGAQYVPYFKVDGTNTSASALYAAALSTSTQDDRSRFTEILSGADSINGSGYSDVLEGHGGDDVLWGKSGNDIIDGGSGIDTAKYTGVRSQYSVTASPDASRVVVSSLADGQDWLIDVEKLQFADGVFNVSELIPTTSVNTLDVIVDLSGSVSMLKGLTEINNGTVHTLTYNGYVFNYADVDSLLTTVVRNGEFTAEFAQEIADSYPAAAGITYNTVVSVVGVADLDNLLIAVAGTDGSYVS